MNNTESPCPACADNRLHTVREWREFHPLVGHGYQEGQGWSIQPEEPHVVPEPAPSAS